MIAAVVANVSKIDRWHPILPATPDKKAPIFVSRYINPYVAGIAGHLSVIRQVVVNPMQTAVLPA
tara:strand:- start:3393 stop:3587 length:195 start_codon:yes stop_codon:yes gene_type:complete